MNEKATFLFLFDKFQKGIIHVFQILTKELPELNEYS